ncbi:MAG: recJ [Paenibacillus sp.]|nr:recJ [Paenibacillus sp.]
MLHSRARWETAACDLDAEQQLIQVLKLHPAVAKLLVARGVHTVEEADQFLNGGKDHLYDPFLLDGMQAAVDRILSALNNNEKIRVYGDYDADGVSSTALMAYLLRQLGADFDTYIPHRTLEGYGLNNQAIDLASQSGVSLLITVDTGISAVDQIAHAKQLGIDVIVTDHHEPPEQLPDALVILNPKKPGCEYPNKQLAGVGVAWKLAHALLGEVPESLAQFAAIGTVADLMPLTGENRCIVKLGLEQLAKSHYPGILALYKVCGITAKEVSSTHLGFGLAPRINASGRLQHAAEALRLLTTEDPDEAEQLAVQLDRLNKERQRIVDEMTEEALALHLAAEQASASKVIVVAQEGWNAGVIGIVAAKLLEKYYRPVVIMTIDSETGKAKGSARSIRGYDIHKALTECQELLEHYGGHQAAAGMTLRADWIDRFRDRLNECAEQWLSEEDYIPHLRVDAEYSLSDVSLESIRQIEAMAPFGMGNPSPRFHLSGLEVQEMRTLGKDKQHLKLMLAQSVQETACSVEAVGFGRGALTELISATSKLDVIGELSVNEWNGVRKPQIIIQDMRVAELQVFDWRGVNRLVHKLGELDSGRAGASRFTSSAHESLRALIVERNLHWARDRKLLMATGWLLYGWDELKGAIPLNDAAAEVPIGTATDLMLYSLPDAEASLHKLLQSAKAAERIYPVFADWNTDDFKLPSREAFKKVYTYLRQLGSWPKNDHGTLEQFSRKTGLTSAIIQFILEVFEELCLIESSGTMQHTVVSPGKTELESAIAYKRRQHRMEMEPTLIYTSAQELTEWLVLRRLETHVMEVSV